MPQVLGIDLGTTNSLVGVMDAGFPILLADSEGERLTPSVVHFPEEGEPLVGRAAARMRALEPHATAYSVKRFIGRRMGEEADDVGYELTGKPGAAIQLKIRGRDYAPEAIAALILQKLRADAEWALGAEVTRAVITVPAYFNDAQRTATKAAGELAGLQVERIVNEPTAAALAYGLDKLHDRSRIAVYDLGGGTFDISILELNQGVFHVLSTNGNTRLGGDDIDAAVVAYLGEKLASSMMCEASNAAVHHAAAEFLPGSAAPATTARLREAAVAAKHALSFAERAPIELPFVLGERSFAHVLTRAEMERLARPVVERTRPHCLRALADARMDPAELDEIILVGGATRMPLVRRFVAELFGREPNTSQNPDEAVALGATIQAGILSGAVQNVVLLDVTPLSLGIETFGGLMNVIIPRNSTIPIKAGEMFTNALAGQRSMSIKVLQGEREMARDNWTLGGFELEFEPAPKGHARVGVQFEIDANGILHVLARDTRTQRERVVQMSSAVDVSDEAVEKMLEESLEHAFEDMSERVFTEQKLKAEEMLRAVEKARAKVGEQLSPAERSQLDAAVAAVREQLRTGAAQPLKQSLAVLDEATQRLATLLVEQALERT